VKGEGEVEEGGGRWRATLKLYVAITFLLAKVMYLAVDKVK
jgi:hypothetical protein